MTYAPSVSCCAGCQAAPMAQEQAAQSADPQFQLSLPTIHCAACIGKVERGLLSLDGVNEARVNLSLKRVSVFTDQGVSENDLLEQLAQLGFEAHPLDKAVISKDIDPVGRALLQRLAVAGFAMMNVMLLSVAVWSGATNATRDLFHLISAAIALPVIIYSAQPFFINAWSSLRVGRMNMDVPISLAIILAAGMSLFETLNSGKHAYFDAALSLTFFLLIGRYLDHRMRAAARSAAKELTALEVHTAQKYIGKKLESTPVKDLLVADRIMIPTGGRIPVDGELTSKRAILDRSFITGESNSVSVVAGAGLQAGEINLGAPFDMVATRVGEDTSLRRMSALVELAENSRNSYTALADRAARIYAPVVHLLALVAFIVWVWISGDIHRAVNVAVAVLIITCPCALGLAVPAVTTAAVAKLFKHGFLIKHATALERVAKTDMVIFDKTGTLTLAGRNPDFSGFTPLQKSIALALAQCSAHPVSQSITRALSSQTQPATLKDITEHTGQGLSATYKGRTVRLGKASWVGAVGDGTVLETSPNSIRDIPMIEILRPGVKTAVNELRKDGYALALLTGDNEKAAKEIAHQLGIDEVFANISAEEKHAHLSQLAQDGRHVLMLGDGLNDTAALVTACASIAPASALDASRSAADIIALRDNFADLPLILKTAKAAGHLSKQNFVIAAIYNLIAVPIALVGLATPLIAALAMSGSSICVLLNALRVRRVS